MTENMQVNRGATCRNRTDDLLITSSVEDVPDDAEQ